jgi:hypothetical protein
MRSIFLMGFLFCGWALQAQDYSLPAFEKGPVYGKNCGFAGVDPPERTQLETLILYQNKAGLLAMLNDSSLVLQAYGAEGVLRLQQLCVPFDQATIARATQLLKSTTPIRTCSGCIYDKMPLGFVLRAELERYTEH